MAIRTLALFCLLSGLSLVALGIGPSWISVDRTVASFLGNGTRVDDIIIWTLRMPRILLAILAGAALALAGLLLQRVTHNPIASPAMLGLVDGAALGVTLFYWLFSNEANALTVSVHWLPVAAAVGTFGFAMATVLVAGKDITQPVRLILYGVAMAALAKALTTVFMILGPVYQTSQALMWLAGSVHTADWNDVGTLFFLVLVSIPVLIRLRHPLGQLVLDDASAQATGLSLNVTRLLMLSLAAFLTAGAVSFAGGIAFVGLLSPHIARMLVGYRTHWLLMVTPLIGGLIVLAADMLARTITAPLELPTGTITALVGAPYFFWLLIREVNRG